jgi:transcriptional regulator with XRE-family HTH domain
MALWQDSGSAFAESLRAAIQASGLSLNRLQYRLRERGVSVSVATLSYWQSGRSQPHRSHSLLALRHLEELLTLPVGSLAALLEPPRPRGRWRRRTRELRADAPWPKEEELAASLRQLCTECNDRLIRISHHDRVEVGPERAGHRVTSRHVLRADDNGVDRCVLVYYVDEETGVLPTLRAGRHCHINRMIIDSRHCYLVAELVFDRVLARGETVVAEHEATFAPPYPQSTKFERTLRFPVREYVLEVSFAAGALPSHCYQYMASAAQRAPERVRSLRLDASHCVHTVMLNLDPGIYGIRWTWD